MCASAEDVRQLCKNTDRHSDTTNTMINPRMVNCLRGELQNFVALIPLAMLLGDVTEDLSLRMGSIAGGLL
jgi:hypothetical protein